MPETYIGIIKRYVTKCFPLPEMRFIKARGTNIVFGASLIWRGTCFERNQMKNGHFYFIKDSFYDALPDCRLMTNKGYVTGEKGGRPCHYCFEYEGVYWMIPISSKIQKFQAIYDSKIKKRGYCDTIRFGYVNGQKRAFLIQNCFPVTQDYIDEEYTINQGTIPVTVSGDLSKELDALLRKVIRLYNSGKCIVLTDLDKITHFLKIS